MRARGAWFLLGLAGFVFLGGARPLRLRARAEQARERAVLREVESVSHRLRALERRERARERAEALLRSSRGGRSPADLHGVVAAALRDADLAGARIRVTPARPPVSARVELAAEGSYEALLEVSRRLTRPESALVLQRVRLVSRAGVVALEVEGLGLEANP